MAWAKTTINCGKNSIHQHAERTMHCRRLSLYKERYAYSWCRSHHYTERQLTTTSTRCFLNICWTRWSQYHKHIFQSVAPSVMLSPPASPPISLLALWLFGRDAACYVTSTGAAAGAAAAAAAAREDTSERTTPTRDCSAQQKTHQRWHENKRAGPATQRAAAGMRSQRRKRFVSGLAFYFIYFFTRRHRLTHHEWCSPEHEKSMVMSHCYTASRARLCRERCMGAVGRSVDGICIPAASSLTYGGSGRDVLENSAQRAAVFGRDGITHLCASAGRETLDLLDLQPVKSKAQSQRRPGGAKEQLVPPRLEKQPFKMFY